MIELDDRALANACADRGSTPDLGLGTVVVDGVLDDALGRVLAHAVHTSRASVMITDADLEEPGPRIVYVNPAFESMTGHRAADVVGRSPRFLQGPATARPVLDRLRRELAAGGSFEGEAVNYRADGTPFVMSWRIAPVAGAGGHATHYVAIQDDVTEDRVRTVREHQLVADLQASLLPEVPARLGELHLAARYRPATPGFPIGGDWYDALERPDGTVHLVVGDVAGSGAEAVAAMGRLRWSVHALLTAGTSLSATASVAQSLALDHELTATFAAVSVGAGGAAELVTCGHPPVVVRRVDGTLEPVRTQNPMLGLPGFDGAMATTAIVLEPGDALLLYTDGVVEGGRVDEREIPHELADRLAAESDLGAEALCRALVAGASENDDAAVLVAVLSPA